MISTKLVTNVVNSETKGGSSLVQPTKARRDDGDQRDARMRCVTHLVCELHMRGPCVGLHAVVF